MDHMKLILNYLLILANSLYPSNEFSSTHFDFNKQVLFGCLFLVLCPTREFFIETSTIPVRGFIFWPILLGKHGYKIRKKKKLIKHYTTWAMRHVSLLCSFLCFETYRLGSLNLLKFNTFTSNRHTEYRSKIEVLGDKMNNTKFQFKFRKVNFIGLLFRRFKPGFKLYCIWR